MSSASETRARGYASGEISDSPSPFEPLRPAVRVSARLCAVRSLFASVRYSVEDHCSLGPSEPCHLLAHLGPAAAQTRWRGAMRAVPKVRAEMAPAVVLRGRVLLGVQKKSADGGGRTAAARGSRSSEPWVSRASFPDRQD